MKNNLYVIMFTAVFGLLFTGCNKETNPQENIAVENNGSSSGGNTGGGSTGGGNTGGGNTQNWPSNVNVYLTGKNSNNQAVYWKNGVEHILPNGNYAGSILIHNNDVYVAGRNNSNQAVYWKNGVEYILPNGNYAISILIHNNDVYITGSGGNGIINQAVYWKNGVRHSLPIGGGFYNELQATSIFIHSNGDVYVGGIGYGFSSGIYNPLYWKNGVLTEIQNGHPIKSIFSHNNDVYFPIPQNNQLLYAKNGVQHTLTNETGTLVCGFVYNNDIYFAGQGTESNGITAKYWKNGVGYAIPGVGGSIVNNIFVHNNLVYATFGNYCWINGSFYTLPNSANVIDGIFVTD